MAKQPSKFQRQFAAARASGAKTFNFGGKSYNTKLATSGGGGQPKTAVRKTSVSASVPIPKARPTAPDTAVRKTSVSANVPTPTPRPTAPGQAPRPGLSGMPGIFGRGTGPRQSDLPKAAVRPTPAPSRNLPQTTTAIPAAGRSGEIQRIVAANRTNPPPADAGAMVKVQQSIARGKAAQAPSEFVKAGVRRGTGGAPSPQSSSAAQQAANRARARNATPAGTQAQVTKGTTYASDTGGTVTVGKQARLTAPGLYVSQRIPPKVVKTTSVAVQKGDRVRKRGTLMASNEGPHDYSRLKFFK